MHLSVPPLDLPAAFGATAPQALKTLGSILGEKSNALEGGGELNFRSSKLRAQVKSCPLSTLEQNCCHRHVFFTLELGTSVLSISRTGTPGSSFSAFMCIRTCSLLCTFPGLADVDRHYQVKYLEPFTSESHVLDTTYPRHRQATRIPPTNYIGQHQQRIASRFQICTNEGPDSPGSYVTIWYMIYHCKLNKKNDLRFSDSKHPGISFGNLFSTTKSPRNVLDGFTSPFAVGNPSATAILWAFDTSQRDKKKKFWICLGFLTQSHLRSSRTMNMNEYKWRWMKYEGMW